MDSVDEAQSELPQRTFRSVDPVQPEVRAAIEGDRTTERQRDMRTLRRRCATISRPGNGQDPDRQQNCGTDPHPVSRSIDRPSLGR